MPLTSFVGRERELPELVSTFRAAALLCLTGPGGGGKTRMALAVAERVRPSFPDGVWWVDLAPIVDPASVPRALAAALQVRETPGRALLDSLAAHLEHRETLVVLNSCEHLLDACAQLVQRLLARCRGLRILTTSREALGVPGEITWLVPPLSLPDQDLPPPLGELAEFGAVRLFADRAATVLPGFTVNDDNAAVVVRVCRRLDGIPLAIELAAARVRVLSIAEIADRLDDRFGVLVAGDRAGPSRHRTLRATLDWSYRLLAESERVLLAELAVFADGFTLDAVAAVHRRQPPSDDLDVLDVVSRLVDRSLVVVSERGRRSRYRLLETVRLYAQERLEESGEAAEVRDRHARFFLALAEQAEPELSGLAQQEWLDRLEAERSNLGAALRWSTATGSAESSLRLSAALWRFCYLRGYYSVGRQWLQNALRLAENAPKPLRAKALAAEGTLAFLECDYAAARGRLEEALLAYRELDDRRGVATALQWLGCIARERGEYERSRTLHGESLGLWRHLADAEGTARSLNYLGFVAWLDNDLARGEHLCSEALALFRTLGDCEGIAWSLISLAAVALHRGDLAQAEPLLNESLSRSRDAGYREGVAWSLNELGLIAARRRDRPGAAALLRDSLREHWTLGDRWRAASVLEALAAVDVRDGEPTWPARVLGAAADLRATLQAPIAPIERPDLERATLAVAERLGPDAFRSALVAGRVVPTETIVEEALARPVPTVASPLQPHVAMSSADQQPLRVTAFGSARIRLGDRQLTATDFTYAKPRELLYYLLDHADRSKDQIGAALWPWASKAQLRSSFHTTLHHLRDALGRADWITYLDGRYALNRALPYDYDVRAFESLLAQARESADAAAPLAKAVALYRGDYLDDLAGESWIDERRAELRRSFENALVSLGRLQAAAGQHPEAAGTFRRAIDHDPLLESAHRELMRCYAAAGERARALRHYQELARLLRDELGVSPAAETVELHARIRHGDQP